MDRPLADKRLIGPFVSRGKGDISEFERIEIERTPEEDTNYTVKGVISKGAVGLVVDTNALTINSNGATSDSYSIAPFEHINGNPALELTPPPDQIIGIKEQNKNIVNIIIEP